MEPIRLSIMLICSEYMNFAIFPIVVLNIDSIGINEKIIITGTATEDAMICVLLQIPIAAPISTDAKMPIAIIIIK